MATSNKLMILGNVNAWVGREWTPATLDVHRIQTVHHQHSVQIAREAQMHIDASPFSKSWLLIDYVITQQRDISDTQITRMKHRAECSMGH